jgi:chromate transporter
VGLAPQAARTPVLRVLGLAALGAALAGLHELLVLGACALMMLALGPRRERPTEPPSGAQPGEPPRGLLPLALGLGATTTAATLVTPTALFLVFVRIGAVLFGSGYVLLAFLRSELVERLGWLTEAQLLDAIAVGQVTPGPVFTTATFIGYVLAGPLGALGATAGIFLPAFVFVALSGPLGGAAVLLVRFKVNATWLIAGGAVVGLALHALG